MRYLLVFIFFSFLYNSCKAQKSIEELKSNEVEVLKTFLMQFEFYGYLDHHLFNKNLIQKFIADYERNKKFYEFSIEICNSDKDSLNSAFYCSAADSFKDYVFLISDDDIKYLLDTYDKEKRKVVLNIFPILERTNFKEHSKVYYSKVDYDEYYGIPDLNELPTIFINNLYFNKKRNIAIIAYSVIKRRNNGIVSSFYILEKKNDIWWKPVGNLKF